MAQSYRALVATLSAHIREAVLAGSGAALLQVWACRDLEEGVVLSTQGLPYFMLGDGDELALFRFMSTKRCFPLGDRVPMGTPASVFLTRQGCAIADLAQLDAYDCPRADCAAVCGVHSVLLLPLLDLVVEKNNETLAVLEVVLTQQSSTMLSRLHGLLQAGATSAGYTFPELGEGAAGAPSPRGVASPACGAPAALCALLAQPVDGLAGGGQRDETVSPGIPGPGAGPHPTLAPRTASEEEDYSYGGASDDGDGEGGRGHCKLSLADLQAQFGNGVKEAARNLGVCVTTLKRSCRRHGIRRWPRRQLVKLQRALAEVGTVGDSIGAVGAGAGHAAAQDTVFHDQHQEPALDQAAAANTSLFSGAALTLSPGVRGEDGDADLWAAAASALGITPPRLAAGRRPMLYGPGGAWADGLTLDGLGLELLGAGSPLRAVL